MTQWMKEFMFQDKNKGGVKSLADELEPYRRLVDLQKQMIELVQQHERTKRECAVLREQLLQKMTRPRRWRWSLRLGTRWLTSFVKLGNSGWWWWWARNRTAPLLLPAKQPISIKSSRPSPGKF